MRGLLVAGTGPDAAERELAAALSAAEPGAVRFDAPPAGSGAPPAIVARHGGEELHPAALVEEARAVVPEGGLVVAAVSGGLLAPLAERYVNRDLARELGLPVVLAAPAGPGLMNGVLLALEAAR